MAIGFTVIDDSLRKALAKGTPERIQRATDKRLDKIGQGMADVAFTLVPVRTGFLQSTIYWLAENLQLEFGATAPYTIFVEFGTRFMAAQPFLRPAWDGWIMQAEAAFRDVIAEALLT
jgi:HK97 gp10 family phage protein